VSETYTLAESGTATVDASGAATVNIGPRRPGEKWQVTTLSVSATRSTSNRPTARLYLGGAGGTYLQGTQAGHQDQTDMAQTLHSGQVLTVVWQGADAGQTAQVTVTGTKTVG
jgi:hypothetical protein